jgi:hypothetical protein
MLFFPAPREQASMMQRCLKTAAEDWRRRAKTREQEDSRELALWCRKGQRPIKIEGMSQNKIAVPKTLQRSKDSKSFAPRPPKKRPCKASSGAEHQQRVVDLQRAERARERTK